MQDPVLHGPQQLRVKATGSFQMSAITCPVTQRHIPKYRNIQLHPERPEYSITLLSEPQNSRSLKSEVMVIEKG